MQLSQFVAFGIISVAMAMLLLVATWAGLSRRHWFLRAAVVCAMLVALYPIRAYEPIVWFSMAMPLTALLSCLTWRRTRRESFNSTGSPQPRSGAFQFRLTDCFLAVLLASVVSAVGAALWREQLALDWRFGGIVLCCVVLHQLCLLVVLSRRWRRLPPAVGLLIGTVAAVALYVWRLYDSTVAQLIVNDTVADTVALPMLSAGNLGLHQLAGGFLFGFFAAVVLTVLFVWAAFDQTVLECNLVQLDKKWASVVAVAALIAAFIPLLVIYVRMTIGPKVPENPYSGPNSYHNIVGTIDRAAALSPADNEAKLDQLYAELLPTLETPGYVLVDFDEDAGLAYANSILEMGEIEGLGRNLLDRSKSAADDECFDEAAQYALALLQIGNTVARGGLYIEAMSAVGLDGMGLNGLINVREDISADEVESLIRALESIEQSREPFQLTIARDVAFGYRTYTWVRRLQVAARWLLGEGYRRPSALIFLSVEKRRDATLRLLIADLAIRRYQAEHGQPPPDLESLVPEFMASVPIDPFSGKSVIYRPSAQGPVVYSVGTDGKDDGGRFSKYGFEYGFDYTLEIMNR